MFLFLFLLLVSPVKAQTFWLGADISGTTALEKRHVPLYNAQGEPRENIANGVIESVVARVASLAGSIVQSDVFLTGGLCENAYVVTRLAHHLGHPVTTDPRARFAGAIGAALSA